MIVADGFVGFTKRFKYLGSSVSSSLNDDGEVDLRIKAAGTLFGKLRKGVRIVRLVPAGRSPSDVSAAWRPRRRRTSSRSVARSPPICLRRPSAGGSARSAASGGRSGGGRRRSSGPRPSGRSWPRTDPGPGGGDPARPGRAAAGGRGRAAAWRAAPAGGAGPPGPGHPPLLLTLNHLVE